MKVLNRPMFRYGGPIKEGIMSGIKEPRRQGYAEPPSFVIQNDPNKLAVDKALQNAKAFENVFKTYDQDLNNQAFAPPVFKEPVVKKPINYQPFDMGEASGAGISLSDDELLQQKLKIVANKANKGKFLNDEDRALAETYGITYGRDLFDSENRDSIESKNLNFANKAEVGKPYQSTADMKQAEIASGKINTGGENEGGAKA